MGFEVERTNRKLLLGNLHNVRFLPLEKMKKQLEKISHPILFACDFARVCNAMTIFFLQPSKLPFFSPSHRWLLQWLNNPATTIFSPAAGSFPPANFLIGHPSLTFLGIRDRRDTGIFNSSYLL